MAEPAVARFTLRDLPRVARVVLGVFLVSVGLGYFSALIQLHFQQAAAGEFLPGPDRVQAVYSGKEHTGLIEKLVLASETLPFNGSGTMRPAFMAKARGWKREIRELAKNKTISEPEAELLLRKTREFEIAALLAWLRDGAKERNWDEGLPLPDDFFKDYPQDLEPEDKFFQKSAPGKWSVKIAALVDDRCARCHRPGAGGAAGNIHLDTYVNLKDYLAPNPDHATSAMSLPKLAQTTHVHLLAFSMLYCLTGLVFALTSYPGLLRAVLAPFPLVGQLLEISCWWLARADPLFSLGIVLMGALVALGLGSQILLSVFDLFGKKRKVVVILLLAGALAVGGVVYTTVIGPFLKAEAAAKAE